MRYSLRELHPAQRRLQAVEILARQMAAEEPTVEEATCTGHGGTSGFDGSYRIPDGVSAVSAILPGLYLGSAPVEVDGTPTGDGLPVLIGLGVTHVLNCTTRIADVGSEQLPSLEAVKRVPVEDTPGDDIDAHLESATAWIAAALDARKVVFVHCEAGVSRSASVVLAFRVVRLREPLRKALDETVAARPVVAPRPEFFAVLARHDASGSYPAREYAADWLVRTYSSMEWAKIDRGAVERALETAGGDVTRASKAIDARVAQAAAEQFDT